MKARESELEQLLGQLEDAKVRADKQISDLRERLQREAIAAQDQLEVCTATPQRVLRQRSLH